MTSATFSDSPCMHFTQPIYCSKALVDVICRWVLMFTAECMLVKSLRVQQQPLLSSSKGLVVGLIHIVHVQRGQNTFDEKASLPESVRLRKYLPSNWSKVSYPRITCLSGFILGTRKFLCRAGRQEILGARREGFLIQGSANPLTPGCENALCKFRHKW